MEGEIRLVAGSTNREGRIELCSNGRWGTVCGDGWTEREAALVCSKLGYSSASRSLFASTCSVNLNPVSLLLLIDATAQNFGEGTGRVYDMSCLTTDTDTSDCNLIITPSSCHSMDVGVRCLPFTDAEVIITTPPCNCQQTMSTKTSQPSDGATTESSISHSTVMSTSVTLGALIGLLAAALVVVVAGWIVTCVYLRNK